jgi:hypothetical protein
MAREVDYCKERDSILWHSRTGVTGGNGPTHARSFRSLNSACKADANRFSICTSPLRLDFTGSSRRQIDVK